jgi:uncharacterized protein involved in propanediol utilization
MQTLAPEAPSRFVQRVSDGDASGTFGELLQGVLLEAGVPRHFLVTLPITLGTRARFASDPDLADLHVIPRHKVKSHKLASLLLDYFGLPRGGHLELISRLPEAKGLASSSADLVASARAIAAHFSLSLSAPLLQALMAHVEPSDGVMYDEIVAFYHREVQLLERLGTVPPLTVVAVDEGGQIDTLEFNARPVITSHSDAAEYAHLLQEMRRAVRNADVHAMGRIATRSAALNQSRLAKRWLEPTIQICDDIGGLGVVAAHSGTYIGVLLATEDRRFDQRFACASDRLRSLAGEVHVFQSRSC